MSVGALFSFMKLEHSFWFDQTNKAFFKKTYSEARNKKSEDNSSHLADFLFFNTDEKLLNVT